MPGSYWGFFMDGQQYFQHENPSNYRVSAIIAEAHKFLLTSQFPILLKLIGDIFQSQGF